MFEHLIKPHLKVILSFKNDFYLKQFRSVGAFSSLFYEENRNESPTLISFIFSFTTSCNGKFPTSIHLSLREKKES